MYEERSNVCAGSEDHSIVLLQSRLIFMTVYTLALAVHNHQFYVIYELLEPSLLKI